MLKTLFERYPALTACEASLKAALDALIACYEQGGKVLLCGNGGSCADCDHIVGELTKGFLKRRPLSEEAKAEMVAASPALKAEMLQKLQLGLPAVSLPSMTALNTAFANDVEAELAFAQGVLALAKKGDVLLALSASGNAANVNAAAAVAKALGVTVISLTGESGGQLAKQADIALCVPATETYQVQELHLPVYHYLCAAVETHFFKE